MSRLIFCFAFFSIGTASAWAAARTAATVLRVKGEVEVLRVDGAREVGKKDTRLFEGDVITTTPAARVKLLMAGGKNTVVLGGGTSLKMDQVADKATGSPGIKMQLSQGSVRSTVNQKYSGMGDDVFEVRTPNAVAGVRGTVFLVAFDARKKQSTLATERGAVEWRAGGANKMVRQGEFSAVVGARMSEIRKINSNSELRESLQELRQVDQDSEEVNAGFGEPAEGLVSANDIDGEGGSEESASGAGAAVGNGAGNDMTNDVVNGAGNSNAATTIIDNEGNVVVVEKEPEAQGRSPASFNSGAGNNSGNGNNANNGSIAGPQNGGGPQANFNPVAANGAGGLGSGSGMNMMPAIAVPDENGNTLVGNGALGGPVLKGAGSVGNGGGYGFGGDDSNSGKSDDRGRRVGQYINGMREKTAQGIYKRPIDDISTAVPERARGRVVVKPPDDVPEAIEIEPEALY